MDKFDSLESFEIKNRGIAHVVRNPKTGNPRKRYVGKTVLIDNKKYKVRGVEMFAINLPYPEGWAIGLLV